MSTTSLTPDVAFPRRRPTEGGYARGEETRARIVEAALEVFAAEGFAKASTRRIAAQAGVNPPALQYYFDSKEGLHRACADVIIAHCSAVLDPALEAGRAALETGDADKALDALCDLLDVTADLSVTSQDTPVWSRFMAQAQGDGAGPGYTHINEQLSIPMHSLVSALVGQVIGKPADDTEVKLRALFILGQKAGLHHNRERSLAVMGWSDFGGPRLAAIKRVVRDQTRAALLAARA